MPTLLVMPITSAQYASAVLAEWLVPESGEFDAEATIATVETEKALVDVPAESAGTLVRILVAAGTTVDAGTPIALLADVDEDVGDVEAALRTLGVTEAPAVPPTVPRAQAQPPTPPPSPGEATPHPSAGPTATTGRIFSSPLARRLAKDAGIPLEDIPGTGPRGRVLGRDVERATHTLTPRSRIRRITVERLTDSWRQVPQFQLRATVRAEALLAAWEQINDGSGPRITLTDLIVKAVGVTHARVPELNVCWTPEAVRSLDTADVAVAVATDRGLFTPVVHDVATRTVTSIAEELRELTDRARTGELKQAELEGGSITVSNLGMYGVEEFSAIINPPHAAILAVGAVRDEPVVDAGRVVPGRVLGLTLTVDHRAVDGVVAAKWLSTLTDLLQRPPRLLA